MEKRKRPTELNGYTRRIKTGCGYLYLTGNFDENGKLFECFLRLGRSGGCSSSQTEAIGRLISLCLRHSVDPESIVSELRGISCHQQYGIGAGKVLSCSDAAAIVIHEHLSGNPPAPPQGKGKERETKPVTISDVPEAKPIVVVEKQEYHKPEVTKVSQGCCSECGGIMVQAEGCPHCSACGESKCG